MQVMGQEGALRVGMAAGRCRGGFSALFTLPGSPVVLLALLDVEISSNGEGWPHLICALSSQSLPQGDALGLQLILLVTGTREKGTPVSLHSGFTGSIP